MRTDTYKGIPRIWKDGAVYTGLVSLPGQWAQYEVRHKGKVIKRVYGLSKKTINLAKSLCVPSQTGETSE